MSEKEKQIMHEISKLPPNLKDRFLDKIEGAAMALDALSAPKDTEKGEDDEPGKGRVSRHHRAAERDVP